MMMCTLAALFDCSTCECFECPAEQNIRIWAVDTSIPHSTVCYLDKIKNKKVKASIRVS